MMDQAVDVSSDLNLDDAFGLHPIHTGIEPRKYDMKEKFYIHANSNQPAGHPARQSATHQASHPPVQPTRQSASQPASQPAIQPASQPASQTASQQA